MGVGKPCSTFFFSRVSSPVFSRGRPGGVATGDLATLIRTHETRGISEENLFNVRAISTSRPQGRWSPVYRVGNGLIFHTHSVVLVGGKTGIELYYLADAQRRTKKRAAARNAQINRTNEARGVKRRPHI